MSEIAKTLDQVLTDLAFAAPVSVDDCVQVRDALREVFPKGTMIEVNCPVQTEVLITVDNIRRTVKVS